ncbi:hypothetical protein WR25_20211, partial [Diploscapter pachys]
IELDEKETSEPVPLTEEALLDRLTELPYKLFVLSEYGRPIYASCGYEEQLCSLFALIGVFVSRISSWGDTLQTISSGEVHVHFSHRSPLILCLVSRKSERLDDQISVVFDQILSTLSREQLESIYRKKGDNFDLRRFLIGTNKFMESSLASWRYDLALSHSAFRVLPMNPTDRDFLSSTMANCLSAAKLDSTIFGLVIAHCQIAARVRHKKHEIHPRDMHILINLIDNSPSFKDAEMWIPICLPHFDDSGFFYAYIVHPWANSKTPLPVCIVLLTVKKDHFEKQKEVVQNIVQKLEANDKFFGNFQIAITKPALFSVQQIGTGNEHLWQFVFKNRLIKQLCVSAAKIPLISKGERDMARDAVHRVSEMIKKEQQMRLIFIRNNYSTLLIWVTDMFELYCIFSPFVTPKTATNIIDKLLKALKAHEQRYFLLHSPSF